MKFKLGGVAWLALTIPLGIGTAATIRSPDGRNGLAVEPPLPGADEAGWRFVVERDGSPWFRGGLGLVVDGSGELLAGGRVLETRRRMIDERYHQPGNKSNPVLHRANELGVDVGRADGQPTLTLELRAYDDAVAFRYVVRRVEGRSAVAIREERTQFEAIGAPRAWPLYLEGYRTSYEDNYSVGSWSELEPGRLIALPLLIEFPQGAAAITEAALSDYAGMYLQAGAEEAGVRLTSALAPLPEGGGIKVRGRLPLTTPWRVILLGDHAGAFIESNTILNLNEPCAIEDTSWLRFGKTTWNWWNGFYQQPVDFTTGANLATIQYSIDFCARNGIAFHAIDCADANRTWFVQSAPGFGPGADADILRPRPELEFERALAYAKSKGVGVRLWMHAQLLAPRLDEAFARYADWGVEGLMVDFLDRDDQEMVRWSEEVLRVAARHHLRIQFHGVWKPTGRRRTLPNLVNHEGVLNLEYLKWSDRCDPDHNVTVPFTRMLAGPMDYHLGGFRAVPRGEFVARNVAPNVLGTRAHHLAMYVVYENPVPMVADGPSAYAGQVGFEFLREVPTVWDETRFLGGAVGEAVVVARRQGKKWYVGAMTNWTPRELTVSLGFLDEALAYEAEMWADPPGATDPNNLQISRRFVARGDALVLKLASGGGQVVRLSPAELR